MKGFRKEHEKRKLKSLKAILKHCERNVPYYRDLFRKVGFKPENIQTLEDLLRLPLLEKRDVPIVTTNVGIASSIIQDYYNGFILPTNCTHREFLDKSVEALSLYNNVDNTVGKERFGWSNYGILIAKYYESLILSG